MFDSYILISIEAIVAAIVW